MTRQSQPIWMTALIMSACGDDPVKSGDATTADSSDTSADTSADTSVANDTTHQPGDVIDPGKTLAGTALDSVHVVWPSEPLVLCNAWQEGATREEELAQEVRITIPPQLRVGLEQADLAAALMDGVVVERGPFSGERWRPAANTATRLDQWTLTETDSDSLTATVSFDLGDAGTITESYYVTRNASDGPPASVQVGGLEVTFGWAPKDSEEGRSLEPCDAGDEHAVSVLSATSASAATTLLRFFDTTHYEFAAGSYPVRLTAWQTFMSDAPWMMFQATDPWAMTYVAQHHNWADDTVVDYERDLAGYQTITKAFEAEQPVFDGAVVKVQLNDVGGSQTAGTVDVTRVSSGGVRTTTTFTAQGEWRRVDRAQLVRALASDCADGQVGAVGYGDTIAQLMWCPDASGPGGKKLVGVVPVLWQLAPAEVGIVVDKVDAISGGWSVAIGDSKLDIEPQDDGFLTTVFDGDGGEYTSAYTTPYELAPYTGWGGAIDSSKDDVHVHIERRWAAQGIGESAIYAVESVQLDAGDQTFFVDAWDSIEYVNTHHNWNDTLAATTDDGHVIHWKIVYDFENGLVETVSVDGPDGVVIPPTVVVPNGGPEE